MEVWFKVGASIRTHLNNVDVWFKVGPALGHILIMYGCGLRWGQH